MDYTEQIGMAKGVIFRSWNELKPKNPAPAGRVRQDSFKFAFDTKYLRSLFDKMDGDIFKYFNLFWTVYLSLTLPFNGRA